MNTVNLIIISHTELIRYGFWRDVKQSSHTFKVFSQYLLFNYSVSNGNIASVITPLKRVEREDLYKTLLKIIYF